MRTRPYMSPSRPRLTISTLETTQVAEDHPQQVEAVRRHQRVELDAPEDVGHRDQRDRRVERREQHRERRVRERDPLVAVGRGPRRPRAEERCAGGSRPPGNCTGYLFSCRARYSHAMADEADPALLASELRVALGQLVRRLRVEHRLSLSHATVLARLDREGTHSISSLAAAERVRPQSMAQTIGDLEADGLVARRPDPTDGRRSLVDMTDEGRRMLEEDRSRRAGVADRGDHAASCRPTSRRCCSRRSASCGA